MISKLLAFLATTATTRVTAFYVPGVHPQTFMRDEDVPLKVNSMTSIHTQLPKEYYKLPFCAPENGPKLASENLGEFLTGSRIQSSPYVLNMLVPKFCQILCQTEPLSKKEAIKLTVHIKFQYHNNWIIDNMPSANIGTETGMKQRHYAGGFPIGFEDAENEKVYVNNHVNIVVDYHQVEEGVEGYRVVGFGVEPFSVKHRFASDFQWDGKSNDGYQKSLSSCSPPGKYMSHADILEFQRVRPGEKILYTYDVQWRPSDVRWASRWDIYMSEDHLVPAQVHWYSIVNSVLVVVFLSCLVLSILVRNLRKDIMTYNEIAEMTDEEKLEEMDESGWKLVHADVFRPPSTYPMLFCVCCGTGVQLFLTALLSIVFSAIGFLSPARRGSLMTANLVFYMMCGSFAGYISARLYKAMKGRQWQLCISITALFFPGMSFALFLFFNIVLFFFQSSGSVPFLDVLLLAFMWCCVSVPLVFLGGFLGYKKDSMEFPTITSSIARAIPKPEVYMSPKMFMAIAGLMPFAAAYVELFFIMTSLWMDHYYYVFGFTLIVFLILVLTCAEVTILLVYHQLCAENHRWWWFSFCTSGSTALYFFAYSCVWFQHLKASSMIITYLLYFGYMFIICAGLFLLTGTIGALSSLWFVKKIFASIKVD